MYLLEITYSSKKCTAYDQNSTNWALLGSVLWFCKYFSQT
jgi:hypothetical protein